MTGQGRFDVFLSHNGRDKPIVERIATRLRDHGITPWLDAWQLTPGGRWQEELYQGLQQSAACAVCIGSHGIGDWSREELDAARSRAAKDDAFRLFAVLLPGAPDPFDRSLLPAFLGSRTWIDLRRGGDDDRGLRALVAAIHGSALGPRAPATPSTPDQADADGPPRSLPAQLSRFIGREQELEELRTLLTQERLLTLTGPGGSGKTRLAIEAASRSSDSFADGVTFVDLSSVRDPALVPSAVAEVLGVREEPGQSSDDAVRSFLSERDALLVLDNLEQVRPAARFIARLLGEAPWLRILATSRTPIEVRGEREFQVEPFPVPPVGARRVSEIAGHDAVRLFVECLRRRSADAELSEANAPIIAEICRRLDGLPLAIELVAARVGVLPPEAVLEQLGGRLQLVNRSVDIPERHRTLGATIGWSVDLLSHSQRRLFAALSVFVGPFGRTAIREVCAPGAGSLELMEALDALLDHHLVATAGHLGAEPRFRLLDTIREFASDQLAKKARAAKVVKESHAAYFGRLAKESSANLRSSDQKQWLDRLGADVDNLRAALGRALETQPDLAAHMVGDLYRFWALTGRYAEGLDWTERALQNRGSIAPPATAAALLALGSLRVDLGRLVEAESALLESLAIYELETETDPTALVRVLIDLSRIALDHDDLSRGRIHLGRALALAEQSGDLWHLGVVQDALAETAFRQGDLDDAERFCRASVETQKSVGAGSVIADGLTNLALIASARGRFDEAEQVWLEGAETSRRIGYVTNLVQVLMNLATMELDQDRASEARVHALEAVEVAGRLDGERFLPGVLDVLGRVLGDEAPGQAAELWAAADAIRRTSGRSRSTEDEKRINAAIEHARALDPGGFADGWTRGGTGDPLTLIEGAKQSLQPPVPASPRR